MNDINRKRLETLELLTEQLATANREREDQHATIKALTDELESEKKRYETMERACGVAVNERDQLRSQLQDARGEVALLRNLRESDARLRDSYKEQAQIVCDRADEAERRFSDLRTLFKDTVNLIVDRL